MKNNNISAWVDFFADRGVSDEQTDLYIQYITVLLSSEVPIIFEKQHLSHLIGIDESILDKMVSSSKNFYREFNIRKKKGGERKIVSPYPSLLMCQKWIYKNILLKDKPHEACHGFTPSKSIITNASIHLDKACLLKMDLKDFFPSIPINWVINYFRKLGYSNNISFYLASLCCYEKKLAQGASTSPYLSNLLLKGLDNRLSNLSKKYQLSYSRYADDLCFSGKYIPNKIIGVITNIIANYGLQVNSDKTSLLIKANKKIITGISVTGQKPSLPREYKRKLKNELHFIKKYGYLSHISQQKIKDPNYLLSILGRVSFWLQVEPHNELAITSRDYLLSILKNN
ncbi:RNA-directed DNA polymerase [Serratia marcescens]|nr:RNA-directed DNA polymerase [Serratia marcescens]EIU9511640.1 RNA-directed DNA polymerase [Serratia marcescens]ELE6465735.1 RNA-directed DNA polymerase [Serratia marcescens]MBH2622305.1 RNA-directed DNA polymerase [Serratia marcescens]HBH7049010.1 RNA-directed DNA polymerase [Serratia marcescens]